MAGPGLVPLFLFMTDHKTTDFSCDVTGYRSGFRRIGLNSSKIHADFVRLEVFLRMDRFQELDEDVSYRSMREYARVSAFLPIKVRRIPEEERRGLMSRIVIESAMTEHPEMPEIENPALAASLLILSSKLDSIIRLLAFPANSDRELDFARVNISAGGLSTASSQLYALDDHVEARLILPTAPFMILYIYGRVLKCDAACEKFDLCIEFTDIDDDIREEIVKFVFHKQREILRKQRNSAL